MSAMEVAESIGAELIVLTLSKRHPRFAHVARSLMYLGFDAATAEESAAMVADSDAEAFVCELEPATDGAVGEDMMEEAAEAAVDMSTVAGAVSDHTSDVSESLASAVDPFGLSGLFSLAEADVAEGANAEHGDFDADLRAELDRTVAGTPDDGGDGTQSDVASLPASPLSLSLSLAPGAGGLEDEWLSLGDAAADYDEELHFPCRA